MTDNDRAARIAQMWADRDAARAAREADTTPAPEHVRGQDGRCRCGFGAGKTYRSVAAHIAQSNRRPAWTYAAENLPAAREAGYDV